MAWSHLRFLASTFLVIGCGSAAALRPPQPAVPYDAAMQLASASFVESGSSPFVVHWQPWESAALEARIREPLRIAVVHYDGRGLRPLKDCLLSGSYGADTYPPYEGTTLLDERGELIASGGPVTQAGVAQRVAAEFRYVVSGKWTSRRTSTRRSELQGNCFGATHFVRGAYTGAFRRNSLAKGSAGASAGLVGFSVGAAGESQAQVGAAGGDLSACLMPTRPDEDRRCSAIIRLELEAVQPSIIASVVLTSLDVSNHKASGLAWDGDNSAPDPVLELTATTGARTRLPKQQDSWGWQGWLPLGEFELSDDLAIAVRGIDADVFEDDPIGALILKQSDLSTGGTLTRPLTMDGVRTAELTFQVTLRTVP